jgi:hypothetical protein
MKYFHLLGDNKQMLESFVKMNNLQLQNSFVEDFATLRSACQDMVRPLLQSSTDEDALSEAHAWVANLGKLFHELSAVYNQHLSRVEELKMQIQDAMW